MKKALLIVASLVGVGFALIYLGPKERKISHVNSNFTLVKTGIKRTQIEDILSKPDTVLTLTDGANNPNLALRYTLDFWHDAIDAHSYCSMIYTTTP